MALVAGIAGAIPIAIFPPFAIPRRYDAVAVIFQEPVSRGPRVKVDRNLWEKVKRFLNCFRPRVSRALGMTPPRTTPNEDFDRSPMQNRNMQNKIVGYV